MLVLICGPSGVGKTSLMQSLSARNSWPLVPTVTTRPCRADEQEKRQVTQAEYEDLRDTGSLFTSNNLYKGWYGTLKIDIESAKRTKTPHLLDFPFDKIAVYFADQHPLTLVLLPDSEDQLVYQLRGAGRSNRIEQATRDLKVLYSLPQQPGPNSNVFILVNSVNKLNNAVLRAEEIISAQLRSQ